MKITRWVDSALLTAVGGGHRHRTAPPGWMYLLTHPSDPHCHRTSIACYYCTVWSRSSVACC